MIFNKKYKVLNFVFFNAFFCLMNFNQSKDLYSFSLIKDYFLHVSANSNDILVISLKKDSEKYILQFYNELFIH